MATASFDEKVIVKDKKALKKLVDDLTSSNPRHYIPSSPERVPTLEEAREAAKKWKL